MYIIEERSAPGEKVPKEGPKTKNGRPTSRVAYRGGIGERGGGLERIQSHVPWSSEEAPFKSLTYCTWTGLCTASRVAASAILNHFRTRPVDLGRKKEN